jgi:hypothetical protein
MWGGKGILRGKSGIILSVYIAHLVLVHINLIRIYMHV